MSSDELSLIASCQTGHLQDFDPLYRTYITPIYRFIYRRTLTKEVAEDLTSVTFIKALEGIRSYSPRKGAFAAWLYRIARNTVTDHYRTQRPQVDIEDVWDLSSDENVPTTVENRLQYEKIREALRDLDPQKRDIILMRLWDGLSYREIAEITGKSEDNCKMIFSRTLAQLKKSAPLSTFLLLLFSPILP
ncbi:MAG: sigma-70 family RNA polymerase sigma factor [Candidatus Peregrinibacteria bacterium]|nr:sigma-70 family RNA polymerase sigma factor [Candidatus Peregrinibacteria bacterium]